MVQLCLPFQRQCPTLCIATGVFTNDGHGRGASSYFFTENMPPADVRPAGSPNTDSSLSNCECYSNSCALFCVLALTFSYIQAAALMLGRCDVPLLVIGHRLHVN